MGICTPNAIFRYKSFQYFKPQRCTVLGVTYAWSEKWVASFIIKLNSNVCGIINLDVQERNIAVSAYRIMGWVNNGRRGVVVNGYRLSSIWV